MVAVSFLPPADAAVFRSENDLPFPVLSDPERRAYRLFGLERPPLWRLVDVPALRAYGGALLGGRRVRPPYPGDDIRQLGGDFLTDPDGIVRMAFYGGPAAHPDVSEILRRMEDPPPDGTVRSGAR